jgi:Kef-type K+ transport system membrane component KefB
MNASSLNRFLPDLPSQPDSVLWIALAVIATGLAGEFLFRGLRLPRVTGYFLVGLLFSSWGLGFDPLALPADLRLVIDLALAVLLFELGSRVDLRWLRANPWILVTSLLESAASFAVAFALLRATGTDPTSATAIAVVLMSTSPAVVMRVVSEFRAAGQVSERLLMMSALNSIYAVLGVKAMLGWLNHEGGGPVLTAIGYPVFVIVGSTLLGVVLALAIRWATRHFDAREDNAVLVLLGMLLLAIALVNMGRLSGLLTPLIAGMVLKTWSERPLLLPRHFGTAGGVLVAVLFLCTGMAVSIPQFLAGGLVAVALVVLRTLAKTVATTALCWPSGLGARQALALGVALAPASGLAFLLTADLLTASPELAAHAGPIVFSTIALLELLGPLAVYWALHRSGETHV